MQASTLGNNFRTIGVRIKSGSSHFVLKASFACFVTDEKAMKEICCLKGASGKRPCSWCRNVIGRTPYFVDDYLIHLSSTEVERFDLHTPETFAGHCHDLVVHITSGGCRTNKEKAFGITFDRHGIIFDDYFLKLIDMPNCCYPDSMHTWLASGGVLQCQLNAFVRKIRDEGWSDEDLDQFASAIQFPKTGCTTISKIFFRDRIVDNDKSHLRGYAGEVLSLMSILHYFAEKVLVPRGLLIDHVDCLRLAKAVVDILVSHAATAVDVLERALVNHFKLLAPLYPQYVEHKFKPHWMLHLPAAVRRFGLLLSCFPGERKGKYTKGVAGFCYNSFSRTVLTYALRRTISKWAEPENFMPNQLLGVKRPIPFDLQVLMPVGVGRILESNVAVSVRTKVGTYGRGDIVQWQPKVGPLQLGRTKSFIEVKFAGCEPMFAGLVYVYDHKDGQQWVVNNDNLALVSVELFSDSCPWVELSGNVIEAPLPFFVT